MKILERRQHIPKRYRVQCDYCTSLLECDENDFILREEHWITCPVCNQIILVNDKTIIKDE